MYQGVRPRDIQEAAQRHAPPLLEIHDREERLANGLGGGAEPVEVGGVEVGCQAVED